MNLLYRVANYCVELDEGPNPNFYKRFGTSPGSKLIISSISFQGIDKPEWVFLQEKWHSHVRFTLFSFRYFLGLKKPSQSFKVWWTRFLRTTSFSYVSGQHSCIWIQLEQGRVPLLSDSVLFFWSKYNPYAILQFTSWSCWSPCHSHEDAHGSDEDQDNSRTTCSPSAAETWIFLRITGY